jgi:hypothetical protein
MPPLLDAELGCVGCDGDAPLAGRRGVGGTTVEVLSGTTELLELSVAGGSLFVLLAGGF